MPATLLTEEPLTLTNAPRLSDIKTMSLLRRRRGQLVERWFVIAMSSLITTVRADYDIVRMRASDHVGRFWRAQKGGCFSARGCAIGARQWMLRHGLEALGATIELKEGYLYARAPLNDSGWTVMRFASVGATENFVMAATLAKGTSVLENAANRDC